MPATHDTVSLDQAKDWARRLHKNTPSIGKLSDAQKAVASMLGHADWHALGRFYENNQDGPRPDDKVGDDELRRINKLYPGIKAATVEVLAIEFDELDRTVDEIMARSYEIESEGAFTRDAIEEALEESVSIVRPPPGHIFVRVVDENGRRVMTLLPSRPAPKVAPKPGGGEYVSLETNALGRFGHDPDPAVDFCKEVAQIKEGFGNINQTEDEHLELQRRVMKALDFRVGGSFDAVDKKDELRHGWHAYCNVRARPKDSRSKSAIKK